MTEETWERLERLYEAALQRPEAERQEFLDRACGEDEALRRELESLIATSGKVGAFLERPYLEEAAEVGWPEDTPVGGRVGQYRLLRKIGEGGSSLVFLALRDDDAFRKEVAIKLLHHGALSTAEQRRRFQVERQVLAGLEHPSIARVLDGGTTRQGLAYLVMEWVDGEPIDLFCNRRLLDIDQRLALFRKVCAAVHYTHQNLVVHRDLKPSNILVTTDGEPKLLDFGIAKLLEPERYHQDGAPTTTGYRLLTPGYASPEQLGGGRITTASDVYSLGVVLYGLLTGRLPRIVDVSPETAADTTPPIHRPSIAVLDPGGGNGHAFDPAAASRARRTRPEQLGRRLRGDLDTIVLKALRREPERRYLSAEQLAEDLRRHAEGLPVRARPDTFGYRAGKFLRRNWAAAAAAAAFVLLILGFGVGAAVQSQRLAAERDRSAEERDRAAAERNRAAEERDQKAQVIEVLKELIELAHPERAEGPVTLREALTRYEPRFEALADQPEVEAQLREVWGEVLLGIDEVDQARRYLEYAFEIRVEHHGEDSLETAQARALLAKLAYTTGEFEEAEALARASVTDIRAAGGTRHPALVTSLNTLVEVLCRLKAWEQAMVRSAEAFTLSRRLLDPTDTESIRATFNYAAVIRHHSGMDEMADLFYQKAAADLRTGWGEAADRHPLLGEIFNNIAVVRSKQDRPAESEDFHWEALRVRVAAYGKVHRDVAQSLHNLAMVIHRQGRYSEADRIQEQAILTYEESTDPTSVRVLYIQAAYFDRMFEDGRPEELATAIRKVLPRWRPGIAEEQSKYLARAESLLGCILMDRGHDLNEARALLETSLPVLLNRYSEEHKVVIRARACLEELR